jgi:transcriptional regulator with XRE-family HTH domain
MERVRAYSAVTKEAARLLGARVRLARSERRWTVEDLAARVGVADKTIRKVEHGDLTVALGTAFEAAAILGITLFDADPMRRRLESGNVTDRLAVLPKKIHQRTAPDDDF